jgi:hypothetical protein
MKKSWFTRESFNSIEFKAEEILKEDSGNKFSSSITVMALHFRPY